MKKDCEQEEYLQEGSREKLVGEKLTIRAGKCAWESTPEKSRVVRMISLWISERKDTSFNQEWNRGENRLLGDDDYRVFFV